MAKRVDAFTTISVVKKNGGKLIQVLKTVYSKDGKTKTLIIIGFDQNGDPADSISVYERQ